MIERRHGDILQADAEALVNTVNCVGIMGRGIALQFRKMFPDNFKAYKAVCDRQELHPGIMHIFDLGPLAHPRYIINFPTKRHWKGNSRIQDIDAGLNALVNDVRRLDIRSIAIPPLGCGLGGLDWNMVRPKIEAVFLALPDVRVLVYEPGGAPSPETMTKPVKTPKMTPGRAALLGLMRRYLAAVMDPFVSLLEIHKLMYFMQEAGEPLRLRYRKAPYGPYAENLRHVLSDIEGHFILGYGDAEDKPDKQIELRPKASEQAEHFLSQHPDTQRRFARVVNLIEGFETAFGLELLATVHWVASREGGSTVEEVIALTYDWNGRKRIFKPEHIRIAFNVLSRKAWLNSPVG